VPISTDRHGFLQLQAPCQQVRARMRWPHYPQPTVPSLAKEAPRPSGSYGRPVRVLQRQWRPGSLRWWIRALCCVVRRRTPAPRPCRKRHALEGVVTTLTRELIHPASPAMAAHLTRSFATKVRRRAASFRRARWMLPVRAPRRITALFRVRETVVEDTAEALVVHILSSAVARLALTLNGQRHAWQTTPFGAGAADLQFAAGTPPALARPRQSAAAKFRARPCGLPLHHLSPPRAFGAP
jgi:hypothetical protein